jgi:hypothetical protein
MEAEKVDEIQRDSEAPLKVFEMGCVSEETKGISGAFESSPMFKNN